VRVAVVGNGRSVHVAARSAAVAAGGAAVRLVTLGPVVEAPGVEVRTRPIPSTIPAAVGAARGFLHDVRSFAPDLLHLHYAGGKLGTMALLSGVRPLVVTVMGGDVLPEQHRGGLSSLERRATRRILETADLLLVKSDGLRKAVQAMARVRGRIETVRWGVDPEVFRRDEAAAGALRARLGLTSADRVILSPRILAPLYNVDLVVEAMAAVLPHVPSAVLVITEYGADEAYRRRLADRAARLGLESRVRFAGSIVHREMPALLSLAEAVVSVPSSDGLPQSLFEAMACGTPAVLGRLAIYEEVVRDGETAVLTDIEPAAIAGTLVRLLTDAARHDAIARAAREQVGRVARLPAEAARVLGLYAETLAVPRPRARGPLRDGRALDALSLLVR
jgi:glycosyltransferase involved in cell wall biosynthesis